MNYLTEIDILTLHAKVIECSGGSDGVREPGLLLSIVSRPKTAFGGVDQFESVFTKAASLLEALVQYHVFVDGNKRTAMTTAAAFLHQNGYDLETTNRQFVDFVLQVAVEKLSITEIASWLEENSTLIN